jgi:hypothetical protein
VELAPCHVRAGAGAGAIEQPPVGERARLSAVIVRRCVAGTSSAAHRLPAIYEFDFLVRGGGLIRCLDASTSRGASYRRLRMLCSSLSLTRVIVDWLIFSPLKELLKQCFFFHLLRSRSFICKNPARIM